MTERPTLVSLFAGVGGFDLGLERAGFQTVGLCELDPHATSVLKARWPGVAHHPDVTTLTADTFPHPDVVTFGSPCQDLSIAGKRAGMTEGTRSGLFVDAVRYIRAVQGATHGRYPTAAVWENVPGAFSSNGGADFAAVLTLLVGAEVDPPAGRWGTAGVAFGPLGSAEWRVLDSRHFGVAQRRARVFLVHRPRGERAGAVLLEREGMRRDPAASGEARPRDPRRVARGLVAGGGELVTALTGGLGSGGPDASRAQAGWLVPEVMPTMRAGGTNESKSKGQVSGDTRDEYIIPVELAPTVLASWGHHGHSSPRGDGTDPIVPVAFSCKDSGHDAGPIAPTLRAMNHAKSHQNGGDQVAVAYAATDYATGAYEEIEHARPLTTSADRTRAAPIAATGYRVRRLTPTECERLQGFPDGWTATGADGESIADTHRYRMMGNAVTVPVAEWIGHRLRAELDA